MLGQISRKDHLPHIVNHLRYMARTGTVGHVDFREQGPYGSDLLREAARLTGIESVILGEFSAVPFDAKALAANKAKLPARSRSELEAVLAVADGFSESTMNDLTDPAWQEIREVTRGRDKLRAIHCLENAGYRDVSVARTGKGDLQRALELYDPHLIVHLTVATPQEIKVLAASGKSAALNPRANASLGLPLPPVHALMKSGVNLLLGTDNGLLNSPNMFAELDFTYKLAKSQCGDAVAPDPRLILRMATTNITGLLGGDHPGCLDVGYPATFVVLDFNQPHLRSTHHIPASIVSRVTPEDVLATYRLGQPCTKPPASPARPPDPLMHHTVDRSQTRNRWNRDYPPVVRIAPGDTISLAMKDASDGQVRPGMTLPEFAAIDKTRIHALTGPVHVDGAEPGDALEIEIQDFQHEGWAWTSIMPGMGALGDEFSDPYLHIWELGPTQTRSMPGVTLDLHPFCGIIGVQQAGAGEFRTRPPGPFGGNMDVRHLGAGAKLFLPVFVPGAGLCAGDAHAAQGDGEVAINGMEAPMTVTLKINLRKQHPLAGPYAVALPTLVPPRYITKPFHVFIESHEEPREAARAAIRRAMVYLQDRIGISRPQALILCSVVLDLKISQMVNAPITTISAYLPEAIFN